jgi:antitoxin (DNA-binding transcriptional repressor) of toxin-antitoxin stability system
MFMETISLEEAQARLPELVHKLTAGQEVLITDHDQPVAKLVGQAGEKPHPVPGRCRGMLTILSEDDEHLKDFKEYMP